MSDIDSKAPTLRVNAKVARRTKALKNTTLNTFLVASEGNVAKQTIAPIEDIIKTRIGEFGRNLNAINPMQMVIAMERTIQIAFSIDAKVSSLSAIV